MLKMIFLIRKRDDCTADEFRRRWLEAAPMVAKVPGLRKYVQNHAMPDPIAGEPEWDGISELWFDDMESFERALASPECEIAIENASGFADLDETMTFVVDQHTIV